MEGFLPENVMLEILSRLSVKTIINCKCVCKSWRNLVSDPYFVDLHVSRSRECLMIHQRKPRDLSTRRPSTLNWLEIQFRGQVDHRLTLDSVKTLNLTCSVGFLKAPIRLVSSVNGLVCVWRLTDTFYVFNPVADEYMILPKPRFFGGANYVFLSHGFGVSMKGEYKVIRIWGIETTQVDIEVYTLGTDQWRNLGQFPCYHKGDEERVGRSLFLNGHVYWIVGDGEIYVFDLDRETFKLFPSPPRLPQESNQNQNQNQNENQNENHFLGILKGCYLTQFSWSSLGFTVWVMKKESWYKEVSRIKQSICTSVHDVHMWLPSCLIDGSEGTSILIFFYNARLVAYCLNTNTILHPSLLAYSWTAITYRPSFINLHNFGSHRVHAL